MAHPEYIREKAVQLRVEKKLTIDEIAERLSLGKTTIYYWVKDIPIPETERQSARRLKASKTNSDRAKEKRDAAYQQGLAEFEALSEDRTFLAFVCMYLGEGTKRCRNTVAICNSDPAIILLGNRWITLLGGNKVRYSVQFHSDQDLAELQHFWADLLSVDPFLINFQRKSNSNQLSGRAWRSPYGVLTVSMGDTALRARLQAWMDLLRQEWK